MQLEPVPHVISKNESLEKIARKYGLPSWKSIYYASCNRNFQTFHPNPQKIHPGETVLIPPKASEIAKYRIDRLRKLLEENDKTFNTILEEWNQQYLKTKRKSQMADVAADVALLGVGLYKSCAKGFEILTKNGDELAKASRAFARSMMIDKGQKLAEFTTKALNLTEVSGNESSAILLTKVVVQSWFDMTTPSYWAQRFSGVNLEELNQQTRNQIISQQQLSRTQLESRIVEAENDLNVALQQERGL